MSVFKIAQRDPGILIDEDGRVVERLYPPIPDFEDPRAFPQERPKKPERPELVPPSDRPVNPETQRPQLSLGDVVRIDFGRPGFIVAVVERTDSAGIYGWYSSRSGTSRARNPLASARERAVDLFVAYQVHHVEEYSPKKICRWESVASLDILGDAWSEASGVTLTNLPAGGGTAYSPVSSSNPLVNTAIHRHKYLFFWYTNLATYWRRKGKRHTYRRVEPLYVFIHPGTFNELLLTLDKSRNYFRSFYVPNIETPKLGAVYAFNPDKMLKRVNKTLTKMDKKFSKKHKTEEELEHAKSEDLVYIGLSGYREHLQYVKDRTRKLHGIFKPKYKESE